MSQDNRDILISISRRNTALSEVANDILDDVEEAPQFHPDVVKLCELLHMPPTTDVVKIAGRVLPRLQSEVSNVYVDFVDELEFDDSKASEFYAHYLSILNLKDVAHSNIYYMFGVPATFNKSYEENYGCAKALIELYGDDDDAPSLWRSIVLFKGRILDAD